jgi:microcystin-dependent protein
MRKSLLAVTLAFGVLASAPSQAQVFYVSQVIQMATNYCPQGTHAADGSLLPIIQYQPLFSLIGTTYGGNGQTTFGLPKLNGSGGAGPNGQPLKWCIVVSSTAFPRH